MTKKEKKIPEASGFNKKSPQKSFPELKAFSSDGD